MIVYSTDGYEEKTPENLQENDFDEKAYKKTELLTNEKIKRADSIKMFAVRMDVMVPLTDKLAATIADRSSIKVRFLKDGETQNGTLSFQQLE